jgi:hypothetical protein
MIAHVDSEFTSEKESSDADIEQTYATRCKALSFDIYTLVDTALNDVESGRTSSISAHQAREWKEKLRELNCCISSYARAAVSRVDRMQIETALVHNAMASDLLDREACHTNTLEVIAGLETTHGDTGPSEETRAVDHVSRALQLVSQMHSSTAPFTSEKPHGYFGAPSCLSHHSS